MDGPPGAETALAWLGELIDRTCSAPPVLVGVSLGGSIAARFAAAHSDRLAGLVLIGMGGLVGKVRIPPRILLALVRHSFRPSERSAMGMLRQVSVDVDRARQRMGARWAPFRAYSLALSRTPSVQRANRRLLRELGLRQIPPEELARIGVTTTLIWGAAGPDHATAHRPGGQRPLRLAPARDRRRRPLPGNGPTGSVPGGPAGGAGPSEERR